MKKVLIITLYGNTNFGNKLQNYALQEKIKSLGFDVSTLIVKYNSSSILRNIKRIIGMNIYKFKLSKLDKEKEKKFLKFNKDYLRYKNDLSITNKIKSNYDYYVYGSDQIWNPYYLDNSELFLGYLSSKEKNVCYAASIGLSNFPLGFKEQYKKGLNNFKDISIREEVGKKIVDDLIGNNKSKVVIDPTMLLTKEDWEKIIKKPNNLKSEKYILNCFLGELSLERKKIIEDFALKNKCDVIDIFDKNNLLYDIGPSEFLYLEKNAYLICTDSFHSCVFSILFDKPFVVFERESNTLKNMYSRIDNLLDKFELKNRKCNGKEITNDNLNHDYNKAYMILEEERKKSDVFLKKALDIKEKYNEK